MKNCIYCRCEISEGSVVDICKKCMYQVWGPKMAEAIVSSMEKEKEKGNMELGRVSDTNNIVKEMDKKGSVVGFIDDNLSRGNFNNSSGTSEFIQLEEEREFISG